MAGFDSFQPTIPDVLPLPLLDIRIFEVPTAPEVWPHPQAPEPDFQSRGMTEARRVFDFYYARTSDERLDALQHLANICALKARRAFAYWNPRPYVKFVGTRTARKDWENCDSYNPALQKANTRGWFVTTLPEHVIKYSPEHITKRELLELARMRDADLLHVCHALVCDLLNESVRQAVHEIKTTRMWEYKGQEFYFDEKNQTAIQPETSATMARAVFVPDYAGAAQLLVKDKKLRAALPERTRQTLELVFRKLDSGMDAREIVPAVASDLNRDQRTVRRHLATAKQIASDLTTVSGQLMQLLARVVLPEPPAISRPTPRHQTDA